MITKDKSIEKICSFYASDYHLEMIMIPYINRKIESQANIAIITEKNLTDTVKTVISKVNLTNERKESILDINWNKKSLDNLKITNINRELIIFVVGNENFINNSNREIEKIEGVVSIKVINCYSIDEVQNSITDIVLSHSKVLNTVEEKELK